ncbi:MZB1 protein, partial [Casuarius casuarius]|nr:MZB1 protein [Casuarius casuarius]
MQLLLAACVALSFVAGRKAEDMCGGPPAPAQPSRSMSAPRLSAEETHSAHMPEHLRCDACRAIAFQAGSGPRGPRGGRPPLHPAPLGATARADGAPRGGAAGGAQLHRARGYGVLEVNGEKRLAGPGLASQEPMSVMMMGGPWPGRLHKMCHSYVGELGEEQLYRAHRSGPAALEELLCRGAKGACAGL